MSVFSYSPSRRLNRSGLKTRYNLLHVLLPCDARENREVTLEQAGLAGAVRRTGRACEFFRRSL